MWCEGYTFSLKMCLWSMSSGPSEGIGQAKCDCVTRRLNISWEHYVIMLIIPKLWWLYLQVDFIPRHLDSFSDCTQTARNCIKRPRRKHECVLTWAPPGLHTSPVPAGETRSVVFMSVEWCWRIPRYKNDHLLGHARSVHIHAGVLDRDITSKSTYLHSHVTHTQHIYFFLYFRPCLPQIFTLSSSPCGVGVSVSVMTSW